MAAWAIDAFVALEGAMDAVPLPDGEPAGPEPLTDDEVARYVAAAVWVPWVHNTQPWRFTARGQQISLCGDAERQLRVADPDGREMMISCGAALFTARPTPALGGLSSRDLPAARSGPTATGSAGELAAVVHSRLPSCINASCCRANLPVLT
jgi:hypothetical protein